tara:strand:+ start:1521 stop:4829 length:3309 start_codon:yes stop_codon:yes gene_type:complete
VPLAHSDDVMPVADIRAEKLLAEESVQETGQMPLSAPAPVDAVPPPNVDLVSEVQADEGGEQEPDQIDKERQVEKNGLQEEQVVQNNPVSSDLAEIVTRPDEDLLILTFKLGEYLLLDALLCYQDLDQDKYFIPLIDFLDALEFPATISADNLSVEGWFLENSRQFNIDLATGKAIIEGKSYDLSSSDVERHADGVYVSLKQLQKWFPVTLDLDFNELSLVVKSLEPLPLEIRKARDSKREGIRSGTQIDEAELPIMEAAAPFFSIPFANVSMQSRYENTEGVDERASYRITQLASGIVAGQDASLSVNYATNDEESPDIRFKVGRKDINGELWGVGLSEYQAGDINTFSTPLLTRGASGRGVEVSNIPIDANRGAQSGNVELRGELPVGYEVDVMRNGQLVGFIEEPDENGEYVFDDLNVLPGLNVFELVFYGPQGQKEVKEERIYVPANPVEKGKIHYKVNTIQDEKNLFTNRDSSAAEEDFGKFRLTSEAEYGLTDTSSLYGALATLTTEGKRKNYALLRYSRSFKGIRMDLSNAWSRGGGENGRAYGVRLQSSYKGLRWQAEHNYYQTFESEQTDRGQIIGDLERESVLKVSGLLPLVKNIPFTLNVGHFTNREDHRKTEWDARFTKNFKKIRFTGQIFQALEKGKDRDTDATLQVSSRLQKLNLRGTARYAIEPDAGLQNLTFNADWRFEDKTTLRFGVSRSGVDDPVHRVTLGGSYDFDKLKLGATGSYDDNDEFIILVNTSFGLGFDPYARKILMKSDPMADTGIIAPRVFYDYNSNGVFDERDEWLEGVGFAGTGFDKNEKTNKEGYAVLSNVRSYAYNTVFLDEGGLPDPFMRSVNEPQKIMLRPSQIVQADYPVVMQGEVDGLITAVKRNDRDPLSSVQIHIKSKDTNEVIRSIRSEFDGFIFAGSIPMGAYDMQPDSEQLGKLGYCSVSSKGFVLEPDNPFASVDEFVVHYAGYENKADVLISIAAPKEKAEKSRDNLLKNLYRRFPQDLDQNIEPVYVMSDNQKEDNGGEVLYDLAFLEVEKNIAEKICASYSGQKSDCVMTAYENSCPFAPSYLEKLTQLEGEAISGASGLGGELQPLDEGDVIRVIDN